MPAKRLGRQTVRLSNPVSVVSYASIGGKLEAQGPLAGYFDELSTDSFFGCKTWEKGEAAMQRRDAVQRLLAQRLRERLDLAGHLRRLRLKVQAPDAAIVRIDRPVAKPREISSRSARFSALADRRLVGGRMPPCSARMSRTEPWCLSNRDAIWCSDSPCCQRSHISVFWVSV